MLSSRSRLVLNFLIGYSTSLSVFGSNLPMNISPKSVYQTLLPYRQHDRAARSSGRTTSYWVTMARVRGLGARQRLQFVRPWSTALRLMVAEIVGEASDFGSGVPARAAIQHALRLDRPAHRGSQQCG